ncbi:MAG: hypothetical protein ACPGKS_07575, partial [Coraliomargarita sp.]
ETLYYLACHNSDSLVQKQAIVDAIYDEFTDQSVQRIDPESGTLDGVDMTYWSTTNPAPQPDCWQTTGLLEIGDGRCGAWAEFMKDILLVHGITSSVAVVDAPTVQDTQKLQADVFSSLPNEGYQVIPIFFVSSWDLSDSNPFNPIDLPGVAGQGNSEPRAVFDNHAVVKYAGKYYDPSYGTKPVPVSKIDWEDVSLDGFGAYVIGQESGNLYLWKERLDSKGTLESSINP